MFYCVCVCVFVRERERCYLEYLHIYHEVFLACVENYIGLRFIDDKSFHLTIHLHIYLSTTYLSFHLSTNPFFSNVSIDR